MEFKTIASGSAGNAYILRDGDSSILIECGIPWKRIQKALNFNTSGIAGCIISHGHRDHFGYMKYVMDAAIDCYAPIGIGFDDQRYYRLPEDFPHGFLIGSWTIKSFPVPHNVPCLGFLIARGQYKCLYISDFQYSPYVFGPGLTHIFLGISYSAETLSPNIHPVHRKHMIEDHLSLDSAVGLLSANDLSRVQEIHIIHCSDSSSDVQMFKNQIEREFGIPVYVA